MTDHGISHARGKQFLYDEGTHVPLVVRGPGIPANVVRTDLVEHIDLGAISLAACGISIPPKMQGQNVFRRVINRVRLCLRLAIGVMKPSNAFVAFALTSFFTSAISIPSVHICKPNAYKDGKSILKSLRALHEEGRLSPLAESLLFSPTRPSEELYEWKADRWQTKNLASDPNHREILDHCGRQLDRWISDSGDHGFETEAMYDSDMAVYIGKGNPEVEKNIQWTKQGAKFRAADTR